MSVHVEAIKLNHDSSSASNDALNIRRNASQFVSVPEWTRGSSISPEDAPAAYSVADTRGNSLTIQARFSGPPNTKAEVRAVDPTITPTPTQPSGCAGVLISILRSIIRGLAGNVLGEVEKKTVSFDGSGDSGFVTFTLQNPTLSSSFVSVRTTTWQWQWREGPSAPSWTDIEQSTHRIYVLLDTPEAPWKQAPYTSANTQLPWTDVLDVACRWAIGASTPVDAATGVTKGVWNLGPNRIEYDCPGGGASHYLTGFSTFDCTAFLDRISGGMGNGRYVNCTDCGTFVSVFSNAVGCALWSSRMNGWFPLNPIRSIGNTTWYPGCSNWPNKGFGYHEVAWTNGCTEADEVYDACLEVDGDADPQSPPHTPLLPTNIVFGAVGGPMLYRQRLTPQPPDCVPSPTSRIRRSVV